MVLTKLKLNLRFKLNIEITYIIRRDFIYGNEMWDCWFAECR